MIQNHQKTLRGIIGSFLVVFGCMIMAFCFHGIILPFMIIWPWAYRRLSEMFLSVGLTFLVVSFYLFLNKFFVIEFQF